MFLFFVLFVVFDREFLINFPVIKYSKYVFSWAVDILSEEEVGKNEVVVCLGETIVSILETNILHNAIIGKCYFSP